MNYSVVFSLFLLSILFVAPNAANADATLDSQCINAAGYETENSGIAWANINVVDAVKICQSATSKPDASGSAWAAMARALYKRDGCNSGNQNCRQIEKAFQKAISLNAEEGYLGLGILYQDEYLTPLGDTESNPLELYRKSVKTKPIGLAHNRIYNILQDDDNEEWRDHFKLALSLNSEHAFADLGRYHLKGLYGYSLDVEKGVSFLEKAAELGSTAAYNELGDLYYFGRKVSENDQKAAYYFSKAVDQESGYAAFSLASMYKDGNLGSPDRKKAEKYFLLGHKWGDCNSPLTAIGDTYFEKQGSLKPDYANAVKWYKKAVESGESDALLKLSYMHRDGVGIQQDEKKADEIMGAYGPDYAYYLALSSDFDELSIDLQDELIYQNQKAADGGNAKSYTFLVDAYEKGYGSFHDTANRNNKAAKAYLLSLAVKSDYEFPSQGLAGVIKAPKKENFERLTWLRMRMILRKMRRAGLFPHEMMQKYKGDEIARYLDLKSNDELREKRIEYIRGPGLGSWTNPTDNGFYPGQAYYNIASTHYNAGDKKKSFQWMRRCAHVGHPICVANIASFRVYGSGVEEDDEFARQRIEKHDESKSGYVLVNFGELYESGNMGPSNINKAVEYYRRSAELGHPRGQSNLAYMYSKGRGVEQDWERAFHWYSKAAEQGQGRGNYGVGVAYDNGFHVVQDKSVANEYFLKAADKNYEPAVEIVEERDLRGTSTTNSFFQAIHSIFGFFDG